MFGLRESELERGWKDFDLKWKCQDEEGSPEALAWDIRSCHVSGKAASVWISIEFHNLVGNSPRTWHRQDIRGDLGQSACLFKRCLSVTLPVPLPGTAGCRLPGTDVRMVSSPRYCGRPRTKYHCGAGLFQLAMLAAPQPNHPLSRLQRRLCVGIRLFISPNHP
jgi:hypothetical protein